MKALLERFQALTEREQKLVMLSGVFVVIALFYFGIWQPLNQSIDLKTQQVANQKELLSWLQEKSAVAQQLRGTGNGRQTYTGSLPQAVNSTTSRNNIVISRMQPQGEDLQVWIDEAAFSDFLAWIVSLDKLGVVVKQLDISEADQAGVVRVRRMQLGK